MAATETHDVELGSTAYEIFVGALSVLSLVNIVLLVVLRDPATQNVVFVTNLLLSAIFLLDFTLRMRRAPSKSGYFFRGFGWADLLASLPFPQVKIFRVFRLVRVIRLMRRYGARKILRSLLGDRAGSALLTLLLIGIIVLEFGSLLMIAFEKGKPGANIENASDALWYCIVTMSTVGYGDQFPVTNPGRVLGSFIIIVGVGIFGTLTGYLANKFLDTGDATDAATTTTTSDATTSDAGTADASDADADAALARTSLAELKELLEQQQATIARLEASLERT
jgi:voltage-gated potassium channel